MTDAHSSGSSASVAPERIPTPFATWAMPSLDTVPYSGSPRTLSSAILSPSPMRTPATICPVGPSASSARCIAMAPWEYPATTIVASSPHSPMVSVMSRSAASAPSDTDARNSDQAWRSAPWGTARAGYSTARRFTVASSARSSRRFR